MRAWRRLLYRDWETSWGGAKYVDPLTSYHEVSLTIPTVDDPTAFNIRNDVRSIGGSVPCILDLFANRTDTEHRAHGAFYGRLDLSSGFSLGYRSNLFSDVKLSFTEAVS